MLSEQFISHSRIMSNTNGSNRILGKDRHSISRAATGSGCTNAMQKILGSGYVLQIVVTVVVFIAVLVVNLHIGWAGSNKRLSHKAMYKSSVGLVITPQLTNQITRILWPCRDNPTSPDAGTDPADATKATSLIKWESRYRFPCFHNHNITCRHPQSKYAKNSQSNQRA